MKRFALVSALMLAPVSAAAQTPSTPPPPPVTAAPGPSRLAAATRLIETIMPPATRAQMMDAMMTPMLANMRQGITQNPQFAAELAKNPKVRATFERFMDEQSRRSLELVRTSLPGMFDAMARAYARRFDVAQLNELQQFFGTPTGQAYMQASMTIMSDPDVAAFQRKMMIDAMSRAQSDATAFAKEVAAIQQSEKK